MRPGRGFRTRGLAAAAALVLLAGQFAYLVHAVAADHLPGEVCEICIGADRLDDGLAAPFDFFTLSPSDSSEATKISSLISASFVADLRSRGPPQL